VRRRVSRGGAGALAIVAAALALAWDARAGAAPDASPVGAYRLADGDLVALVRSYGRLRLVDYGSGAFRGLRRLGPGLYAGGPGASVLRPTRVRVRLEPGGGIRVDGRPGRRLPLVAQTAIFADGLVRLVGRLLRPPGRGPFPAVAIVPGSERAHRTSYDLWAYFFAAHGIAVLTYDKRGVGASGGRYDAAATVGNLRRLAADALAAVAWLRRQRLVDRRRIGLSGGSQAGWVIELAGARSPHVRWAALQSAPAMSVGRQLAYAALTGSGWRSPPPSEREIAAGLAGVPDGGFDPRAAIASLRIPVLWQLGAIDKRMYTPETVADLRAVAAGGTHDFTLRVYPGGAHSLRLTAHGLIREERASPGLAPGVFADLAAWLRRRVLAPRR